MSSRGFFSQRSRESRLKVIGSCIICNKIPKTRKIGQIWEHCFQFVPKVYPKYCWFFGFVVLTWIELEVRIIYHHAEIESKYFNGFTTVRDQT